MQCNDTRRLLFDYHDGSLTGSGHAAVETHLTRCELCRRQLADIRAMAGAAAAWQDQMPPAWQPSAIADHNPPAPRRTAARWARDWLPLAACLVLTVFVVSGAEVGTNADGVYVRFGTGKPATDVVTDDQLATAIETLRREQAMEQQLLSEALLNANRDQRRREMEAMLALVGTQLDVQTEETVDSLRFLINRQQQDQRRLSELDRKLQTINYQLPERERR